MTLKKDSYQERNRIAQELYETFAKDLSEISFRVDETIGLNTTNPTTRQSLRAVQSSISKLIEKSKHTRDEKYALTRREREVLIELATGASVKEICERMFLSQPTVKTHLGSIYKKLLVTNKVEAINKGKALGLLP